MRSVTRSPAQAIPAASVREIDGTAHAVTFDARGNFVHARGNFVQTIADAIRSSASRSAN